MNPQKENPINNSLLRVSNILNLTRHEFTLIEKHIYLTVIANLKEAQGFNLNLDNEMEVLQVVISPLELKETNRNRIKEALDKIVSRKIFFDNSTKNDEYFGYIVPIFYANYKAKNKSNSQITIQIAPAAKKLFLELANGYTTMDLKAIMSLTSSHAIRIYELLSQYKNQGSWTISIEELRDLLGLSTTQYKNFRLFEIYILEYCQKELLEHCGISFDWEIAEKQRKKITALTFTIRSKEQLEKIVLKQEIKQTIDFIKQLSPKEISEKYHLISTLYQLTPIQIDYIVSNRDVFNEFIRLDIIIEDMITKGKPPRNRTAYLAKSLGLDKIKFKTDPKSKPL
ncbi:replication initiation protein [Arcicella sp. LKC2W]|uniref:replication initiation protein n=1 Tax=Arcicella sp. LKC2W TaxID=2984198 RepID=UPI002B216651|nr:replication initiation protein [Arcicella sp. LKC2W]MEA5462042.1 replication initiation protein [Arcicella sp. LKC2W]